MTKSLFAAIHGCLLAGLCLSAQACDSRDATEQSLERNVAFESHEKQWTGVLSDLSKSLGVTIVCDLGNLSDSPGFPVVAGTGREILDSMAIAMGRRWELREGCVLFLRNRGDGGGIYTLLKQATEIQSILNRMTPAQMTDLLKGQLSAKSLDEESKSTLLKMCAGYFPAGDRIAAGAWSKARLGAGLAGLADILDDQGRTTKTIQLNHMTLNGPDQEDYADQDAKELHLTELAVAKPARLAATIDDWDVLTGFSGTLRQIADKIRKDVGLRVDYDSRVASAKYFVVGAIPRKKIVDILARVSTPMPLTERKSEKDVDEIVQSMLDSSLSALKKEGSGIQALGLSADDLLGEREMKISDFGALAIASSPQLGSFSPETKIRLRAGLLLTFDPFESAFQGYSKMPDGRTVGNSISYQMTWVLGNFVYPGR